MEVNDGSSLGGIQCVLPLEGVDDATMKGKSLRLIDFFDVPNGSIVH